MTLRTGWNERLRHHIPKLRVAIASSMLHLAKKRLLEQLGQLQLQKQPPEVFYEKRYS